MSLVLGTATPGGGFPVYGDAVAATLNEVDPALDVTTRNTKGSTENVPLLEAGALDGLGLDQTHDFAPIFLDRAGDGHRDEAALAAASRRELIHAGVLRYLKEIGLT